MTSIKHDIILECNTSRCPANMSDTERFGHEDFPRRGIVHIKDKLMSAVGYQKSTTEASRLKFNYLILGKASNEIV